MSEWDFRAGKFPRVRRLTQRKFNSFIVNEPRSVLQSHQLDPRPFLRLDNARQLAAEIMLLRLRHTPPSYGIEM